MAQPAYTYTVKIDNHEYDVNSDVELTDEQAYQAAKVEADKPEAPKVVDPTDVYKLPESLAGNPLAEGVRGFLEGSRQGMKGFAEGVLPGAVHAVTGIPATIGSLVRDTGSLAGDIHDIVTDEHPLSRLGTELKHGAVNAGQGIADTTSAVLRLAAENPEAYGKQVGDLTGSIEGGLLLGKGGLKLPKPLVRNTGKLLANVGKTARWPLRMVGAHELGSGNPMGVATMMMPEALTKGGEGLQRLGVDAQAVRASFPYKLSTLERGITKAGADPALATGLRLQLDELRTALEGQLQGPKLLESDIPPLRKQLKELDQLSTRLENVATPKIPKTEKSVAAKALPGYRAEAIAARKATEKAAIDAAEATNNAEALRKIEEAQAGLEPTTTVSETVAGTEPSGTQKRAVTRFTPKKAEDVPLTDEELLQKTLGNKNIRIPDVSKKAPVRSPASLPKVGPVPAGDRPMVKVSDIPETTSKIRSATKRLSVSDLEEMGYDPTKVYTELPADVAQQMLLKRRSRHGIRYSAAKLDTRKP